MPHLADTSPQLSLSAAGVVDFAKRGGIFSGFCEEKWSLFPGSFLDFEAASSYNVMRNIGESILRCVCCTLFSGIDPSRNWKKLENLTIKPPQNNP